MEVKLDQAWKRRGRAYTAGSSCEGNSGELKRLIGIPVTNLGDNGPHFFRVSHLNVEYFVQID